MKRRNLVNPRGAEPARGRCIYGVHPVMEWLRAQPAQLHCIHYDQRAATRLAPVVELATAAGVVLRASDEPALSALAGSARHQGVVATAGPFPYVELRRVREAAPRLVIIADHMQDPQNLGALLRTAEAAGAGAVIIPKDGSVPVTAAVEVAAAGAAALVPVCRVTNTARALRALKEGGYWSVGLVPRGGVDLYRFDPPERVVLVVGGEAGMRPLVVRHCDFRVTIPMTGKVESLNASVAAAIVIYELRRRWNAAAPTIVSGGSAV